MVRYRRCYLAISTMRFGAKRKIMTTAQLYIVRSAYGDTIFTGSYAECVSYIDRDGQEYDYILAAN